MSNYNPRVIAQALDELEDELTRWSSTASDTLSDAANKQREGKESVERALHRAAILKDRAEQDQINQRKSSFSVEGALEKSKIAKSTAIATLQEADKNLQLAKTTLIKWQVELKKALEWLARAEDRLAKAIQEYNRATNALRSAESNLRSAEARLRNCQNDRERGNCSGEAASVNRALGDVAAARRWVRIAELEVTAAKEEVAQAKARVACCKQAVAYSTEAVQLAEEGKIKATEALNSAERGLEFAESANKALQVARTNVSAEMESAEKTMSEAQAGSSQIDEAAVHLRNADSNEDDAQIHASTARKEIAYRIQLLNELNSLGTGDWSLPKNVSPSEIKVYTRSDGKTQIIYGKDRDENGQIIGKHGHTVLKKSGEIDFARKQDGNVLKDTGE